MEELDYEEILDEAEDELDETEEIREGQVDSFGTFPEQEQKDSIYQWFWKVTRLKKPFQLAKVGNLSKEEIGPHQISVRDAMNLAILGRLFHHPTFGNYFATVGKIVSASSMSKNGWFMDLSISQKKVRERKKQTKGEQTWRLFGKKKPVQEQ